jgi:hypothetical protein
MSESFEKQFVWIELDLLVQFTGTRQYRQVFAAFGEAKARAMQKML